MSCQRTGTDYTNKLRRSSNTLRGTCLRCVLQSDTMGPKPCLARCISSSCTKALSYVHSWLTNLEPTSRLEQARDRQPQLSLEVQRRPIEFDSRANYEQCRYFPVRQECPRKPCSVQHEVFLWMPKIGPSCRTMRKNVWRLSLTSCAQ